MTRHICIMVSLLIVLVGCATHPDVNQVRLQSLPQHYTQFDIDMAWQVKSAGSQTVVDGEFKNLRYAFMDNIEVWVAVLGAS